jgi:hypothetical protein
MEQQNPKKQLYPHTPKTQCVFLEKRTLWCTENKKKCDSPSQQSLCPSYQLSPAESRTAQAKTPQSPTANQTLFIGTKTGKCDICKTTKRIIHLKYGFTLCENCLSVCTAILEQLQLNEETLPQKRVNGRQPRHPQTELKEA